MKKEGIDFKMILPEIYSFYDEWIGYMESSIEKNELYFINKNKKKIFWCKQMKKTIYLLLENKNFV